MNQSDIRRLNQRFAEDFGRPNGSQPKYAWKRTSDLFFSMKGGTSEHTSPAGVIYIAPTFARHCWADILGDTWVIAQWKPPMPLAVFEAQFGSQIQYPANGQYYPIENTALPQGMVPDEQLTAMAVHCIREQLEKPFEQTFTELQTAVAKDEAAKRTASDDMIDSDWPAYDNVPGMKLNTSFPSTNIQPAAE